MKNLYYIKGKTISHSMWFGESYGKENEFIGIVSDYSIEHKTKDSDWDRVCLEGCLNKNTKEFSIHDNIIKVTEYRLANKYEVRLFNKAMTEHNLVYEERNIPCYRQVQKNQYSYQLIEEKYNVKSKGYFYKNKDNFLIRINNNEVITYKELKEKPFSKDDKIILKGDNGYSYWWAETTPFEDIFKHIESIFADANGYRSCNRSAKAITHYELYGWQYGNLGELKIDITKENVNYHQVSNT